MIPGTKGSSISLCTKKSKCKSMFYFLYVVLCTGVVITHVTVTDLYAVFKNVKNKKKTEDFYIVFKSTVSFISVKIYFYSILQPTKSTVLEI